MNNASESDRDPIEAANRPWDGRWSVQRPADYVAGLYRMHQLDAHDLLKLGSKLSGWEANFLQVVAYQSKDLSETQRRFLARIERDHQAGVAA